MANLFLFRALLRLLVPLIVLAATSRVDAQGGARVDAAQAYDRLWNEAIASVLAIAAIPDVAKEPVDNLNTVQARLERTVVRLISSEPPVERLADHFFLLPSLQEVAAAARAVVDARNGKDEPALASASTWLDESLVQLAAATRQARQSTSQP